MDIHRNQRTLLQGVGALVLAVVFFFSPQLLAALGYQFVLGDWVGYGAAALMLITGIVLIVSSRQAFALRVDTNGVAMTRGGTTATIPWDQVSRVSIEKRANDGRNAKPTQVIAWTPDSYSCALAPERRLQGLNGYLLIDLREARQSRSEIADALRRYAGRRFVDEHVTA